MTKQFKIQFFSHLRSKNVQITFIISYSGRAFQQCQEHAQNSFTIFSFALNYFSIKNWSIFNIFSVKQFSATLLINGLGDFNMTNKQAEQSKLPSFR
jgi:hypothetical protein